MTPKEKAIELYSRYYNRIEHKLSEEYSPYEKNVVKQCALTAVDEILYALSVPPIQNKGHLLYDGQIDYWQQVKQEIEKL